MVVRKAFRFARKEAHGVNLIPHEPTGRWKARREEIYLLGKHGHAYADHMKRVGRFLPRTSSFAIHESSSR
jgi:hypothetical protein